MADAQILTEMQSLIYNNHFKKCLEDTKNKDVTLFLGNTRSGKSTTVNYVIGNALKSVKDGRKKHKIYSATEVFQGPKIGKGSLSETTFPTAWNSSKISGLVVDAPGFDDNRGVAQDVANAFHIKQLIENIRSIKIVLIVDISEILHDNISSFVALFNKIHDIFPESDKLKNGMLIVFTKDNEDTSVEEICETMKEKVIDQTALEVNDKGLVNFFIENKGHIIMVKMPEAEGIINDGNGIFGNLISAIENNTTKLSRDLLNGLSLGISDKSRTFLLQTQSHLLEFGQFNQMLSSTESTFKNYLNQTIGTFQSVYRGNELINLLNDIEVKLNTLSNNQETAKNLLHSIKNTLPNANVLSDLNTFDMKLDFISFVDQILQRTYSATLTANVKNSITNMKRSVMDHKNNIRIKIGEIQVAEERQRLAREEAAHAEKMRLERERQAKLEQEQEALQKALKELEEKQKVQQLLGGINNIVSAVLGNLDEQKHRDIKNALTQVAQRVNTQGNPNCRVQ